MSEVDAHAWSELERELDAWGALGREATFWWRDDDLVAVTPALDRLSAVAGSVGAPVALAVIPAGADAALVPALAGWPGAFVLQHGFAHTDHASPPARRAELGIDRPVEVMLTELREGERRLRALFGARFLPVLVPPWGRIAPELAARRAEAGLSGLSTHGPRQYSDQVNVHVDLIDWRRERSFVGDGPALASIVGHLAARRRGAAPIGEPTGILTHHLVHGEPIWRFLARFGAVLVRHGSARWQDARSLWGFSAQS